MNFKELFEAKRFQGSLFDFKNKPELTQYWKDFDRGKTSNKEDYAKEFFLRKYYESIETYIDGADNMFKDREKIKKAIEEVLQKNFNKIEFSKLQEEFEDNDANNDYYKKFINSISYDIKGDTITVEFTLLGKKYKGKSKI